VDEVRPQVIFHLAAQVDVRRSVADPRFDARTNVEGTINVLDAARGIGARVVNVSTGGAIYGDVDTIPTAEDVEPLPEAPYGQSKFCAERYVALYRRLFGLSGVTARLGNVYGPRQDPLGEAGVIAIFCGLLEPGEQPTIFGSGDQTRDYIYIADVVEALLALLAEPAARGEFNIGTGRATSVRDIIAALAPFADGTFEPRFAPARDGEIEHSCLDVTRAREELGWTARTELADGLRRTLEWTRAPSAAAAVAG
jgi:UDP-glucose 4-epimerase